MYKRQKEIKEAKSKISREESKAISWIAPSEGNLPSLIRNWRQRNNGPRISRSFIPIPSVGCYVPGGQARYPSSVAMSVTPAKIAGVKRIVVVSPPGRDGKIDPLTIAAAKRCGATEIYKVGGAQAIGALAYGTKSIP